MRYIDTSHITVPTNWVDLAKKEFGKDYPSLWSYFKPEFEKIVGKKCWYSESKNEGAVNPIDHYRPKADKIKALPNKYKKILDAIHPNIWTQLNVKERDGYPFLEFEFGNYRYCCDIVNSETKSAKNEVARGKSNYFPLESNSISANNNTQIELEQPCLLDPCNERDVELLSFNNLGFLDVIANIQTNSWDYCRVKVSIEIYHLSYERFVEKRKQLWNKCEEHIKLAGLGLTKNVPRTNDQQANFLHHLKELREKISKKHEFSSVAIDCIRFYKKQAEYNWLDKIFPDSKLKK